MKKLSILSAAMVLFIGISFANPVTSNQQEPKKTDKTDKKVSKKEDKKDVKKVPVKKKADSKDQKTAK